MKKMFSKLSVLMLGALTIAGAAAAKTKAVTVSAAEANVVRIYFTGVENWNDPAVGNNIYVNGVVMSTTTQGYGKWVIDLDTATDLTSLNGPNFEQGGTWWHPDDGVTMNGEVSINYTFKTGYQYLIEYKDFKRESGSDKYYSYEITEKGLIEARTDENWGLVGDVTGWGWENGQDIVPDLQFTYNEDTYRYELITRLEKNTLFKLRKDRVWGAAHEMSWDGNTDGNKGIYLQDGSADHNFQIKETNDYLLTISKGAGTAASRLSIYVSVPDVEKGKEVWSVIGSFLNPDNGTPTNWDHDVQLTYNANENRYEVPIYLSEYNQFKLRYDHKWKGEVGAIEFGWRDEQADSVAQYLEEGNDWGTKNGNFQVKAGCSGWYLLKLSDEKSASFKTNADFSLEPTEAVDDKVYIANGTEANAINNPGTFYYWNDHADWGPNYVDMQVLEHYLENDVATFTLKKGNDNNSEWAFQLYYHDASVVRGKEYKVSFDLESSVEGNFSVNSTDNKFLVNKGSNHITKSYSISTDEGKPAFVFFYDTSCADVNVDVTIKISNIRFEEVVIVDPQVEADAFVKEWLALRNEEGSICDQVKGDATALKDMIAKYDALTPEVKTIVDASLDREGNTIQNSVEYLRSFLGLDEVSNNNQSTGGLLLTAVKDNAGTIAIVMALIVGTFVGYIILRRKNKLVKTSK